MRTSGLLLNDVMAFTSKATLRLRVYVDCPRDCFLTTRETCWNPVMAESPAMKTSRSWCLTRLATYCRVIMQTVSRLAGTGTLESALKNFQNSIPDRRSHQPPLRVSCTP